MKMGIFRSVRKIRKTFRRKERKEERPLPAIVIQSTQTIVTRVPKTHDPIPKMPPEQRKHMENLYSIGTQLVEESQVCGSKRSHSTEDTDANMTPVGQPEKGILSLPSNRPRLPTGDSQRIVPSSGAEEVKTCSMFEALAGLSLCGQVPSVSSVPSQEDKLILVEKVQLLSDSLAVPVPREISFTSQPPSKKTWEDQHILLSEVEEETPLARKISSSILYRFGKPKEEPLPKMRVYVEKPRRLRRNRSSHSADNSTLTGPTVTRVSRNLRKTFRR